IVHDDKTSDADNIPERIFNEIVRRNLLGRHEMKCQESVSAIALKEPVSKYDYHVPEGCIASSDQLFC
ncbi:hypothetical protein, partial [Pantoea vagans]